MKTTLLSGSLAMAVATLPCIAASEEPGKSCADREKILRRLESAYGETRQSVGLGANNSVMELFASQETGTWTITVTLPTGKTCLLASGQAFETLPPEMLGGDDA